MNLKKIEVCLIAVLENSIGYEFKEVGFLNEALSHSSFVNESPEMLKDNERLEFLGDSILNFIISDLLVRYYPQLHEGCLSRMRANLVNESQLSIIARSIKLGSYLRLGKGELQTKGRQKNSILADALEALIAAVYLDGGISSSFLVVEDLFHPLIKAVDTMPMDVDYKSKLQEKTQVIYHKVPNYVVADEYGPDHKKIFKIKMTVGDINSYGEGTNKKAAEQSAAKKALEYLMIQS